MLRFARCGYCVATRPSTRAWMPRGLGSSCDSATIDRGPTPTAAERITRLPGGGCYIGIRDNGDLIHIRHSLVLVIIFSAHSEIDIITCTERFSGCQPEDITFLRWHLIGISGFKVITPGCFYMQKVLRIRIINPDHCSFNRIRVLPGIKRAERGIFFVIFNKLEVSFNVLRNIIY